MLLYNCSCSWSNHFFLYRKRGGQILIGVYQVHIHGPDHTSNARQERTYLTTHYYASWSVILFKTSTVVITSITASIPFALSWQRKNAVIRIFIYILLSSIVADWILLMTVQCAMWISYLWLDQPVVATIFYSRDLSANFSSSNSCIHMVSSSLLHDTPYLLYT